MYCIVHSPTVQNVSCSLRDVKIVSNNIIIHSHIHNVAVYTTGTTMNQEHKGKVIYFNGKIHILNRHTE